MTQKLIDQLVRDPKHGAIEGILATTYELQSAFFDDDWLPTVLGLSSTSQHQHTARVALQRALAETEAVSVLMDARTYRGGRPSLRVEVVPRALDGGALLHAKVFVTVQRDAVRLVVGSANLTEPGHRKNREVAAVFAAHRKDPKNGALIAQALRAMPERLQRFWTPASDRVWSLALRRLREMGVDVDDAGKGDNDDEFVWSDEDHPLVQKLIAAWPAGEQLQALHIVSPFWSADAGNGPLSRLLRGVAERAPIAGATVELCAPAEPFNVEARPLLPDGYGRGAFERCGTNVVARAVVAAVSKEEAGDDVRLERSLHAKIILLIGKKTSVAYLGSANFTHNGLGRNIEAGVLLRRRGKARDELLALLPPLHAARIPLDGSRAQDVGVALDEPDAAPWPNFIDELRLVPSRRTAGSLALRVVLSANADVGWQIDSADGATRVCAGGGDQQLLVELEATLLEKLLIDREVRVRFAAAPDGVLVPLNVDEEARATLPAAPAGGLPGEAALLAYYQGRLRFEDLFGNDVEDAADGGDDARKDHEHTGSEVDTVGSPGTELEFAL